MQLPVFSEIGVLRIDHEIESTYPETEYNETIVFSRECKSTKHLSGVMGRHLQQT